MKISSFYKQVTRTVKFSLAALICSVALNFGTAAPSLAAQVQAPTPHLAIFGWGEKTQGQAKELVGKAQSKTGKQVNGRADYDLGRVEDTSRRNSDKAGKIVKDIKKGTDKNLSKAGDSMKNTANNLADGAKKAIDN